MLAVIDETAPFIAGGVHYAVVSAIVLDDEIEARAALSSVVPPGRKRPFHWHQEGIVAITAMESAVSELSVLARAVVVPCGRRRQEAARAVALEEIVLHLLDDGCDRMVIEGRTPTQDRRDQEQIARLLRRLGVPNSLTCSWDRKSEPLVWLADALGGAVHDHLTGNDHHGWYDKFAKHTGLALTYACLPAPPSGQKRRQSRLPS